MILDAGTATISRQVEAAGTGGMPTYTTTQVTESYYGNKTVGVNRYYTAKANNDQTDLLVEIQRCGSVRATDVCTLASFEDDGISGSYRILQVQHVVDEDGLPMTDLALERIE